MESFRPVLHSSPGPPPPTHTRGLRGGGAMAFPLILWSCHFSKPLWKTAVLGYKGSAWSQQLFPFYKQEVTFSPGSLSAYPKPLSATPGTARDRGLYVLRSPFPLPPSSQPRRHLETQPGIGGQHIVEELHGPRQWPHAAAQRSHHSSRKEVAHFSFPPERRDTAPVPGPPRGPPPAFTAQPPGGELPHAVPGRRVAG